MEQPGQGNNGKLTPQQEAIVRSVAENRLTIVGAGAGSGKTYTTVQAVLDRLENSDAKMDQFILITFTQAAARELKLRLEKALRDRAKNPQQTAKDPSFWLEQMERIAMAYVGTIHGFCLYLLRTFGYSVGVAREASPTFAAYMRLDSLREAVDEHLGEEPAILLDSRFNWEPYKLQKFADKVFSLARNQGIQINDLVARTEAQPGDSGRRFRVAMTHLLRSMEERYSRRKREGQLLDGNDLIESAARLLDSNEGESIADKLSRRYRYLFLDEFQDTDPSQGRIVEVLYKYFEAILLVGDSKQAIYRFRGAISLMEDLAKKFRVDILPLNQSRRPTRPLLDAQNRLFQVIGANGFLFLADPLYASEGTIEPQSGIIPLQYEEVQADGIVAVADAIIDLLQQQFDSVNPVTPGLKPVEPGDIVVLARTNSILQQYYRGLARILEPQGIQVRVENRGQFYRRPEIIATLNMLRLILRFPDDVLLPMVAGGPYLPDVDFSDKEYERLRYGPVREGHPISDWFEEYYPEQKQHLEEIRRAARVDTVPQTITRMYQLFGVYDYYEVQNDELALANLEKLRELARQLFQDEQALTLAQFVSFLQLKVETQAEEEDAELPVEDTVVLERPNYVRLMTIHGAKGREFPFVLIPKIERRLDYPEPQVIVSNSNGLDMRLPDISSSFTESPQFANRVSREVQLNVEEEMRILYVAVTRAQHAVLLFGTPPAPTRYGPPKSWLTQVITAIPFLPSTITQVTRGRH